MTSKLLEDYARIRIRFQVFFFGTENGRCKEVVEVAEVPAEPNFVVPG